MSKDPRENNIHPIVISGTCKVEKGTEQAKVISITVEATERTKQHEDTIYRTVCIASDGEAKRGDALVRLTMKENLDPESPIYPLLSRLEFMNHLVGQDDITADKDFKHVFKRQRNLLMRNKGIEIEGLCITPAVLKIHLESNNISRHRLQSLLNPNDKQDVLLAYGLLKEIWSLPDIESNSPQAVDPIFAQARKALQMYGKFARHLIQPYLCVDMNLDEQLESLSTALHLLFHFYVVNNARDRFMNIQSYLDIMIMIKNVYYCVAKLQVDDPTALFFLCLLGSDRLEKMFGLIRTAVGPDNNVDILQLGSRASGLTEVSAILSQHPEWDRSPRRLNLPAMTKDALNNSADLTDRADHISPSSWKGNVCVGPVSLLTCWILGRQKAEKLVPGAKVVLERLSVNNVDIFSPFGSLLFHQANQDNLDENNPVAVGSTQTMSHEMPVYEESGLGDVEDAIAEEHPRGCATAKVTVSGKETSKPRAIRDRMLHRTTRSSTDRLKRVQEMPCFASTQSDKDLIDYNSELGAPCIRIGNPASAVLRCEDNICLAIVQVTKLQYGSNGHLQSLAVPLLVDSNTQISCQILRLVPTTVIDDPSGKHDWAWSSGMDSTCENIPGQFIYPINPPVAVRNPGVPTFLFESSVLLTIATTIHQQLTPKDLKDLPTVKRSEHFPYRYQGKSIVNPCLLCVVFERLSQEKHVSFAKVKLEHILRTTRRADLAATVARRQIWISKMVNTSLRTWRHIYFSTLP